MTSIEKRCKQKTNNKPMKTVSVRGKGDISAPSSTSLTKQKTARSVSILYYIIST
jgi:hypothetical protein